MKNAAVDTREERAWLTEVKQVVRIRFATYPVACPSLDDGVLTEISMLEDRL